ncbi:MAG TPA: acyltransferase [Mucilaginibacter sp.]|nr:acyltransferase [Mucilaginibacter sp.]
MGLKEIATSNPGVKRVLHRMIVKNARPRWWVRWFVTPFIHNFGKGSVTRRNARMDIFPFNKFSLGANSTIEDFSTVNNGVGNVFIGSDSRIGIGSVLIGPVTIGNQVILAQNIVLSGLNHSYTDVNIPIRLQKVTTSTITVEDEVWIGANAVVTAGVTIGKHSVIAGGSVVTKNIPPFCVAVGNPAKIIKRYDHEKAEWVKVI